MQSDPSELQQLPTEVREGYVEAFAASLDTVFLVAVPFALVAFALAWFLKDPTAQDRRHLGRRRELRDAEGQQLA